MLKLGHNVEVLTVSPEGIWAFNKPAGVLSHPNDEKDQCKSLINAPYNYEEEVYLTDEGPFYLLHRLDGPTSGVIIGTPFSNIADKVLELMKARKVRKYYNAIVSGQPRPEKALWRDHLKKADAKHGRGVRAHAIGGGAPAESQMIVVEKYRFPKNSAMIELRPLTGRTHQLRIQCAMRGHPIIGDATYGDFDLNKELRAKELLLHARVIEIPEMNFVAEAPMPTAFKLWGKGQS